MVGLVKSMVGWYQDRSLDPQVWERFLCYRLGPSLMPKPSEYQLQFEEMVNIININISTTRQQICGMIIIGGSKGGRQGRAPPPGGVQILSFSCSFREKKLKNNSTFGSWRTSLGKILDPPLIMFSVVFSVSLLTGRLPCQYRRGIAAPR